MLDPIAAYRTSQVLTASPAGRVVLLYQGAIRQATLHLTALQRSDAAAAHQTSIRCQEIVGALQESLDLSAGPIADQLSGLYSFVLGRLIAGNIAKDPRPTAEALQILRELLPAWQTIASQPAPVAVPTPALTGPVAYAHAR